MLHPNLGDIWITTRSGTRLHVFDPKPDQTDINSVAHSLANVVRWGGHCDPFYSVGEHSIEVGVLVERYWPGWGIYGVIHDGSESAGIGDMSSPVKKGFPMIRPFEKAFIDALRERYDIEDPPPHIRGLCKEADNLRMLVEARDLMPKGVYEAIAQEMPADLVARSVKEPKCVPGRDVKQRFLELFWHYLASHRAMIDA